MVLTSSFCLVLLSTKLYLVCMFIWTRICYNCIYVLICTQEVLFLLYSSTRPRCQLSDD
jgi:hypothetical protein